MDFFITTGQNSGVRKKENLHALYSMLEYCEEPNLCRRMMQLQFLGEAFSNELCMRMCDNCRRGQQITQMDKSREAIILLQCVQGINEQKSKISVTQLIDLMRGKKVSGAFLKYTNTDKY